MYIMPVFYQFHQTHAAAILSSGLGFSEQVCLGVFVSRLSRVLSLKACIFQNSPSDIIPKLHVANYAVFMYQMKT